jgi:hypothetical protein
VKEKEGLLGPYSLMHHTGVQFLPGVGMNDSLGLK